MHFVYNIQQNLHIALSYFIGMTHYNTSPPLCQRFLRRNTRQKTKKKQFLVITYIIGAYISRRINERLKPRKPNN